MRRAVLILCLMAACGDDGGAPDAARPIDAPMPIDAAPGPDADPLHPLTLAETGLCVDAACTQISPDVQEFAPEYILWSDGATKRRWISLPAGTTIDTSDMDYWTFPEGTKLWKEFTVDNVRVETRLLQKIGPNPGDWYMMAFAWNDAQDAAVATPTGAMNVLGTAHDIPSQSQCRKCHERTPGRVIGFSAILLDHPARGTQLNLAGAIAANMLSAPPTDNGAGEYFPIPGDAAAQAALGYLHVNCGNCHNPTSDIVGTGVLVDWRLRVGLLGDVTQTPPYTTAVGVPPVLTTVPGTSIIEPHDLNNSEAYNRMISTSPATMMPPIGHELVDPDGTAAIAAWIGEL